MREFPTKLLLWTCAVLFSLILVITAAGSILLGASKPRIVQTAGTFLNEGFQIGYIVYLFPDTVILKDVVISEGGETSERHLRIPTALVKFRFWDFALKREFTVARVDLRHPHLHYDYLREFLRRNGERLLRLWMQLPRMDFDCALKEAFVDFGQGASRHLDHIYFNLSLSLKEDTVVLRGSLRQDKYGYTAGSRTRPQRVARGFPLEYDFKGILIDNGFLIDNLAFKRKNFYGKLWGSFQHRQLRLNGFSFIDTYPREEYEPLTQRLPDRVRAYLARVKESSLGSGISLDDKDVYIIDMDGLADFLPYRVSIRHFDFDYNGIPASLKGEILFSDVPSLDLDIALYPAKARTLRVKNIEKVSLHLAGTLEGKVFTSSSDIDMSVDFNKAETPNFPLERIEGDLEDFRLSLDQYARPLMRLGKGDMTIKIDENVHRLYLENLEVSYNALDKKLRLFEIRAPFYDGRLSGKLWIIADPSSKKMNAAVTLNDVDVGRLDDLFIHFAKAEGRLSGKVNFTTWPRPGFDGGFTIYDGQLKKFEFFQWIANTFHLPSLRKVDFQEVSAAFSADADDLKFHDIRLKAQDVDINGYFHIDRHNLVSSYLSLGFSRRLLGESPKFRPILKIFGDDVPIVVFDFQLSGRQDAMNFQWLPSEHKRRIQERIPDFVERIIERNVDEMIEPPTLQDAGEAAPP